MSDRQQRIKALFNSVVELGSAEEQAAYLAENCPDETLRAEVRALVSHEREMGRFLEHSGELDVMTVAMPPDDDDATAQLDVAKHPQIGPYTIRELLGEGGMGYVYVAEQTKPVRRKVALKVIKPGMDTKEVIARFEAERQALAMMSHPNIAKVLDAGTIGDEGQGSRVKGQGTLDPQPLTLGPAARPFFVMELVRGVPITQFCDQQKLTTRERLDLFLQVCGAVQHAHMKGIIHRDLKPSNVIVELHDVKPVPKVIDFGVAKATGERLTQHTVYTQFSQLVGTPLYMSPEQAKQSALDIDTRSDIYSLGVLLYELLTGTTPFDKDTLSSANITELQRIICEDDPPRPSLRISTLRNEQLTTISASRKSEPRQLGLSMQRELDWIVMKALEKDRTRRYETASAFAADIQRYLDDEPVLACPPSVVYRLRKYARRHKGLLTTTVLVLLALISGTGVATWQAVRANAAEQVAEDRLDDVEEERDRAEQNMRAALAALEQLLNHVANPDLFEIPELQPTHEKILEDALAFYDEFASKHGTSPDLQARAVGVMLQLGRLASETSQKPSGIEAYDRAIRLADGLVRRHPDRREYQELQARAYREAGGFHRSVKIGEGVTHPETALKYLEQARLLYERLSLLEPGNKEHVRQQVSALRSQAAQRWRSSRSDPLVPVLLQQAEQLMERSEPDPSLLKLMAEVAAPTNPDRADELFRSALQASESRLPTSSSRTIRYNHAWIRYHVANHFRSRHPDEANRLYGGALDTMIEMCHDYPSLVRCQNMVMEISNSYAMFLIRKGQTDEARDVLERSRKVVGPKVGAYNIRNRARPEFLLGEYELALADLKTALEKSPSDLYGFTRVPGNLAAAVDDPEFREGYLSLVDSAVEQNARSAEALATRASILLEFGDFERAQADLDAVAAAGEANYYTLYQTALLSLKTNDPDRYRDVCQRMLTLFGESEEPMETQFTAWTCALAPDAVDDYAAPLALAESAVVAEPMNQQYLNSLGAVQLRAGLHEEALATFEKSAAAAESDNTSSAYDYYFRSLAEHALDRTDAARQSLANANELAAAELDNDTDPPAWNRKLTLELLRAEAETLIGEVDDEQELPPQQ